VRDWSCESGFSKHPCLQQPFPGLDRQGVCTTAFGTKVFCTTHAGVVAAARGEHTLTHTSAVCVELDCAGVVEVVTGHLEQLRRQLTLAVGTNPLVELRVGVTSCTRRHVATRHGDHHVQSVLHAYDAVRTSSRRHVLSAWQRHSWSLWSLRSHRYRCRCSDPDRLYIRFYFTCQTTPFSTLLRFGNRRR